MQILFYKQLKEAACILFFLAVEKKQGSLVEAAPISL